MRILLPLLLASAAVAGECDRSSIRWFLPDQFAEARAAAKQRKRLLILKGIAFGVDEKGARCATDGSW